MRTLRVARQHRSSERPRHETSRPLPWPRSNRWVSLSDVPLQRRRQESASILQGPGSAGCRSYDRFPSDCLGHQRKDTPGVGSASCRMACWSAYQALNVGQRSNYSHAKGELPIAPNRLPRVSERRPCRAWGTPSRPWRRPERGAGGRGLRRRAPEAQRRGRGGATLRRGSNPDAANVLLYCIIHDRMHISSACYTTVMLIG